MSNDNETLAALWNNNDDAKAFYVEWLRVAGYNPLDWEDRSLLDYIADYLNEYCEENGILDYADVPDYKLEDIALSVTEF